MLDFIFFIPLMTVIAVAATYRLVFRRKSFGPLGWLTLTISLLVAAVLPLGCGVWLPDIFGSHHTLGLKTARSGHQVSVVQYWNHEDFYTTETQVTAPNGAAVVTIIDGDDHKSWGASLKLDSSKNEATFTLSNGRTGTIFW